MEMQMQELVRVRARELIHQADDHRRAREVRAVRQARSPRARRSRGAGTAATLARRAWARLGVVASQPSL